MASAVHQRSVHTSSSLALTPQARNTFQSSFDKFEHTVKKLSKDDQRDFSSTGIQDVWKAARELEQQLAARQSIRNLRRIEPLLHGLEKYSKVVEVLCNGTPYLPWLWAPIKLLLKLAADYDNAFEKLISAYSQIAEHLPRFDRLSEAYRNHPDFQRVIALVYGDILEFHRRAYKFFKRSGWQCFFNSMWGRFDARFNRILGDLSRHADLVDREANAFLITETMHLRQEALEEATRKEKERSAHQLTAVLSWLNLDNVPHCGQQHQEDTLDRLTHDCYSGTTEWIVMHQKTKTWMNNNRGQSTLWITGKPGSGKSTICAKIAQFLRKDRRSTILFCFYTYHISGAHPHPSIFILATLLSQLLRQYKALSAYVYVDFVAEGLSPSLHNLRQILATLIPQVKAPRILVDGVDECIQYDNVGNPRDLNLVKHVLKDILQLISPGEDGRAPKLLIVSRDILQVTGMLSRKPTLRLDNESDAVNTAIRLFTKQRLKEIREHFDDFQALDGAIEALEDRIVQKAKGMFLWVKLVLTSLEDDAYNLDDLETAVANMPIGLNEFYTRITARISLLNPPSLQRVICILRWMICARRPLRSAELQDAVVFSDGNTALTDRTKLPPNVIDLCKPMIQTLSDGTVTFVHSTIQEYLVNSNFITLLEAELCVTLSCLAYLGFSFNLLDTSVPDERRTVDVGKGFYSLQPYVQEHWLDHVLAYASINGGRTSQDAHFNAHVNQLMTLIKHCQERHPYMLTGEPPANSSMAQVAEPRLAFLKYHTLFHELIKRLVQHRTETRIHFGPRDGDFQAGNEDPTPFSAVHADYNNRVHILLDSEIFPGLTTLQLATFKDSYGPFAFVCRYPGCPKSSTGFSSDESRIQHESTHAPPLLCTYSGCTYTLRFQSLQGLKRHIRENHGDNITNIPKSIRRRPREGTTRFSAHPEVPTLSPSSLDNIDNSGGQDHLSIIPAQPVSVDQSPFTSAAHLYCVWCSTNEFRSLGELRDHQVEKHGYSANCTVSVCGFCSPQRIDFTNTVDEFINHLEERHPHEIQAIGYMAHLKCLADVYYHSSERTSEEFRKSFKEWHIAMLLTPSTDAKTLEKTRRDAVYYREYHQTLIKICSVADTSLDAALSDTYKYLEAFSSARFINMEQSPSFPAVENPPERPPLPLALSCLWCPQTFWSLQEGKHHHIEAHAINEFLDPPKSCDFCLRWGQKSRFNTILAYVFHLGLNHEENYEAIAYRAHIECLGEFSITKTFTNVSHHFLKLDYEKSIRTLRTQLANDEEDTKNNRKLAHNISFVDTLVLLRPRLFTAVDSSHSANRSDARVLRKDELWS